MVETHRSSRLPLCRANFGRLQGHLSDVKLPLDLVGDLRVRVDALAVLLHTRAADGSGLAPVGERAREDGGTGEEEGEK